MFYVEAREYKIAESNAPYYAYGNYKAKKRRKMKFEEKRN